MSRRPYGPGGLLALALAACSATPAELPTCTVATPDAGVLRADGTALRDALGRQVTLRGVNTGGRSKTAPFLPFDLDDDRDFDARLAAYLDRLDAWGFDVARVPFAWEGLEPERGRLDLDWLDRYDALLDGLHAHGLWAIVDFHQDVFAAPFCGDGFPLWAVVEQHPLAYDCRDWSIGYAVNPDVQANFARFWDDTDGLRSAHRQLWSLLAARYADHPAVIGYEPINEPGWVGLDPATWSKTVLTPFYTDLGDWIRRFDHDGLVFFDATGLDALDGQPDLDRPEGPGFVFAPHWYAPGVFSGEPDLAAVDVASALGGLADLGESWELPVLLGEFGVQADVDGAVDHLRRHYDAFDARGLHATLWEYSASTRRWNDEGMSVVDVDGAELPTLDAAVRPYVRALAGSGASFAYDPDFKGVTLAYDGHEGGITEVVLPTRVYDTVSVRGSGACQARDGDRLLLRAEADGAVQVQVVPL